ncbi:MAG: oligosaccharide flippase family protein [Prevotella sp.]|nr:oligosaccharide flippase family protein [Prevotella sp.]
MESKLSSTYRRIVSSTAVFGGAQLFNMLVNIVRGKLVATILHSKGLGMASIFNNASNTLQQMSMLGLNVASVPTVSQANADGNAEVLAFTIRMVRRLVLFASAFGLVLTVALSPLMANISFDESGYTPYFMLLSVAVFLNVMGTGELAILQGMRRYKLLAFCSTVPPLCGLLLSVPIYYFWGMQGIVPAMIVLSVVYFSVIRLISHRITPHVPKQRIGLRTLWTHGHDIIKFGAVMTIGSILGTVTSYGITIFINHQGTLGDVGFFQAGNTITTQLFGLVFSAMAADYFPHLSSLIKTDQREAFAFANQQTEIILLIVAPVAMLLILATPLAIRILLTSEFLVIERMVRLLAMASILKALCFPMDYIVYAKGDTRYLFWVETLWSSSKTFCIIAVAYTLWGVDGLGYGMLGVSVVDVIVTTSLISWRYGFRLSASSLRIIAVTVGLTAICLAFSFIEVPFWRHLLMAITTAVGLAYSIRQLDQRLNLKAAMKKLKDKLKKKES